MGCYMAVVVAVGDGGRGEIESLEKLGLARKIEFFLNYTGASTYNNLIAALGPFAVCACAAEEHREEKERFSPS